MSLLSEIQADVTEANADIAAVLRKCKVLAVKLGNKDFQSWVDYELNGYPSENETPDYRIIKHIPSYGHFIGIGWSQLNDYPIPISAIPEKYREAISTLYLTEPISYYSSLIAQFSGEPTINWGWNPDFIAYLRDKILSRFQLTSAWQSISTSSLVALIDTVKNRVLNLVLEIEAVAPNAGEPSKGEKPIPEERVQQVFNTVILGGSAQIAAGNQTIKHDTDIKIIQNDFDSLRRFLSSLKVGEDSIRELREAIQEDEKNQKETAFGKRVQNWLEKMISKAADGSWQIAKSVAANLLTIALKKYFGI
ncbi:MAG: hypothetical protein MUP49_04245 [Dehalococcoidia bacterium]|nr:hypothetical protein [Dehalococcoidia bacterium]